MCDEARGSRRTILQPCFVCCCDHFHRRLFSAYRKQSDHCLTTALRPFANMHSFIFPEDLETMPVQHVQRAASVTKRLKQQHPAATTRPRRPLPIIVPSYVDVKSKDEVVVSVTRLSLDERSPRLQKPKEKRPSTLTRWKSATLSKSEKEERETRMALLEAERAAHEHARIERRPPLSKNQWSQLSPLVEHDRESKNSPQMDYGIAHVMF